MRSMTLEQLRAASDAGGVMSVTLKGQGGTFLVQIVTRSGADAVLAKARSSEPRRFGNPASVLNVLRDLGSLSANLMPASGTRRRRDLLQAPVAGPRHCARRIAPPLIQTG